MSVRELLTTAAAHGMRIQFSRERPGICAVICKTCGYGDGWFDQRAEGYEVEPYTCPRCTLTAHPASIPSRGARP